MPVDGDDDDDEVNGNEDGLWDDDEGAARNERCKHDMRNCKYVHCLPGRLDLPALHLVSPFYIFFFIPRLTDHMLMQS